MDAPTNRTEDSMPTTPGYYVFYNGAWRKTDQLTFRTFANTLHIR